MRPPPTINSAPPFGAPTMHVKATRAGDGPQGPIGLTGSQACADRAGSRAAAALLGASNSGEDVADLGSTHRERLGTTARDTRCALPLLLDRLRARGVSEVPDEQVHDVLLPDWHP